MRETEGFRPQLFILHYSSFIIHYWVYRPDKPTFEAFRNRLFALKAFTYIDRFSLKMSRRKRKIFKKSATVGGDRCGAGVAGITPR